MGVKWSGVYPMTADDDVERDDLMDMKTVAAELHVSRSTVQRYVDSGDLQPVAYSENLLRPKKHLFTPEAVEALKHAIAERRRAKTND